MLKQYLKGLCACLLLTACAATPPTNFYVLEALSQPAPATIHAKKHLIGIGPLSIPALLDRRQIITRKENNAIAMAEFHQWASPLKDNILTIITKNIATLQPNALVKAYPWSVYGDMDYRVIIDINRFDSQLGQSTTLEASWAIMEEKNHTIIRNGQVKISQPLHDANYESLVLAHNKLLDEFSQQLSLVLLQLLI